MPARVLSHSSLSSRSTAFEGRFSISWLLYGVSSLVKLDKTQTLEEGSACSSTVSLFAWQLITFFGKAFEGRGSTAKRRVRQYPSRHSPLPTFVSSISLVHCTTRLVLDQCNGSFVVGQQTVSSSFTSDTGRITSTAVMLTGSATPVTGSNAPARPVAEAAEQPSKMQTPCHP